MALEIVTGGTTGDTDGTLVDDANKIDFSAVSLNTAIACHMRGAVSTEESDNTTFSMPSGNGSIQVAFVADSGPWYDSDDAPQAAPAIGPVNIPVWFRQTVGASTATGSFTTGGTFAAATAPSQVTGLTATNPTEETIDLAWNAGTDNVGVKYYRVKRATNSGMTGATTLTSTETGTTYQATGLAHGTQYWFTVEAIDAAGAIGTASATANNTTAISYTEVDPNSHFTFNASTVTISGLTKNEDAYLYKDYGVDYFDALDEDFTLNLGSTSDASCAAIACAFTNTIEDLSGLASTDVSVRTSMDADKKVYIWLSRGPNTTYVSLADPVIVDDTTYYCTLRREAGSDTVYLDVFSDSGRTTHVTGSPINTTGFGTAKWRYHFALMTRNQAAAAACNGTVTTTRTLI